MPTYRDFLPTQQPITVDDFLRQQYRRLGLGTVGITPRPYATQGFPQFTTQEFRTLEQEKDTGVGIGDILTSPFKFAIDLISAGEYAVASFADETIKALKGEEAENPILALLQGLAAPFGSDEEFRRTFGDVLDTLGWDPQTTEGKTLKGITSFAASILLDPLTYLTFGATGAAKIPTSIIKRAAKNVGVDVAERYAKGQVLNRLGGELLKECSKKYIGKTFAKAERYGERVATQVAERRALEDISKILIPIDGKDTMKLIRSMGKETVDDALRVLGREPSEEAYQWFMKEGRKKLLDRGGLKFFGKTLFTTGDYLAPRTSGLTGLIIGDSLKKNLPLTHRIIDRVGSSKAWKAVVTEPLQGLHEVFGKAFKRDYGNDLISKNMLREQDQIANFSGNLADRWISANMAAVDAPVEVFRFPGREGAAEIPVLRAGREATLIPTDHQKLLYVALYEAEKYGVSGEAFPRFFRQQLQDEGSDTYKWFTSKPIPGRPYLNLAGKVTTEDLDRIGQVGRNVQDMLQSLRKIEDQYGISSQAVVEAYLPHVFKNAQRLDPDEVFQKLGGYDFFNKERRLVNVTYSDLLKKADDKIILGAPEPDLKMALLKRVGASFRMVMEKDAIERYVAEMGRTDLLRKVAPQVLQDPKFRAAHPELSQELAFALRGSIDGLPAAVREDYTSFLKAVETTLDPEKITEAFKKWKIPANVTQENKDLIMKQLEGALAEKAEKVAKQQQAQGAAFNTEKLQALETLRKEIDVLGARLDKEIALQPYTEAQAALKEQLGPRAVTRRGPFPVQAAAREVRRRTSWSYSESKAVDNWSFTPTDEIPRRAREASDSIAARIDPRSRWVLGRRAEQFAARFTRARQGVDAYAQAVTQGTRPPVEAAKRSHAQLRALRSNVEAGLARIAAKSQKTPKDLARAAQHYTEWHNYSALLERLPSEEFLDRLTERLPDLAERAARVQGIRDTAKALGVSEKLPALLKRVSAKKLAAMDDDQLTRVEALLTRGRTDKEELVRFLEPLDQAETEAFRTLADIPGMKGLKELDIPGVGKLRPEDIVVPKHLVRSMVDAAKPADLRNAPKLWRNIVELYDAMTYPMKRWFTSHTIFGLPRPAFFFRNLIDLTFRRMVGMSSLTDKPWRVPIRDTWDVIRGAERTIVRQSDGSAWKIDELREAMMATGAWHHNWLRFRGEKAGGPIEFLLKKFSDERVVSYRKLRHRLYDATLGRFPKLKALGPERMGTGMENFAIAENFLQRWHRGVPIDSLIDDVNRFMFNYNALSHWERNVMRRVAFFYTFSRQAVPFAWWVAKKKPWVYKAVGRIQDLVNPLSEEDEKLLPQWVKDYPFINLERSADGKKLRMLSMRNTFAVDVVPDLIPNRIPQLVGQLNPILTVLPELYMGKDAFFRSEIPKTKILRRELSKPVHQAFAKWLEARDVELAGKPATAVNGYKWHLTRRLWFARIFRDLDELFQLGAGDTSYFWGLASGFKVLEYEADRQQGLLDRDSDRLHSEYRRALKIGDAKRAREVLDEVRLD